MMSALYDHPLYRALLHTSKRAAPYMLEADLDGAAWVYRPHRRLLTVSPTCTTDGLAVGLAAALAASTNDLGPGPISNSDWWAKFGHRLVNALAAIFRTHKRLQDTP